MNMDFEIDRDGGDSPRQRVITHWLFVGDQPTEYGVQKVGLSAWECFGPGWSDYCDSWRVGRKIVRQRYLQDMEVTQ